MTTERKQYQLSQEIEKYLAALSKLYEAESNRELQELVVNAQIRVHEEWSFDNWNGGTAGHAIFMTLPEGLFLRAVKDKELIQSNIKNGLNALHNVPNEFIEEVFIEMESLEGQDWRLISGLLVTGSRVVSETAQKRLWNDDHFRLFLSHKTSFKKEAAKLKEQLSTFGVSCFVAHEDIKPTQAWQTEIENALTTMDGFVALLTPDFREGEGWTDHEVGFAFARGVPRIAVMLGQTPYAFIGKFQGLKCSWDESPLEIASILIENERMFACYANKLRKCTSFNHGNEMGLLLPRIGRLANSQVDELVRAYNENGELRGSFAFAGTKPLIYGPGLISHIERTNGRKFRRTSDWTLEEVPTENTA